MLPAGRKMYPLALHEQDRHLDAFGVPGVRLVAGGVDDEPPVHDRAHVPERGEVADAEHVVELVVGGIVELVVGVGAAVDGVDPPAQRLAHRSAGHGCRPQPDVEHRVGDLQPDLGFTVCRPTRASTLSTLSAALTVLRCEVTGWSGNCMHTVDRTSSSPSASAMSNEAEPTQ